jgi:oligoribonuclease
MKTPLVWMDLEMTGLEPCQDEILEVALLVTDEALCRQSEGHEWILHMPQERFAKMDAWNQNQHTQSGLWEKALSSSLQIETVENEVIEILRAHMGEKKGILAGNSIWQDRRFIRRYMPKLDAFLHYRMLDVSSFKVVLQHWYPKVFFKKEGGHRALADIQDSIGELEYYRKMCFLP